MKKLIVILFLYVNICCQVFAEPSDPTPRKVIQPNGDTISISLHGDEYGSWYETRNGELKAVYAPNAQFSGDYQFVQLLNEEIYAVESPDAIVPFGENAYTVMRYSQNNNSAAVAYLGKDYRSVVCGFPFETLATEAMQQQFMQQIIDFLTK